MKQLTDFQIFGSVQSRFETIFFVSNGKCIEYVNNGGVTHSKNKIKMYFVVRGWTFEKILNNLSLWNKKRQIWI